MDPSVVFSIFFGRVWWGGFRHHVGHIPRVCEGSLWEYWGYAWGLAVSQSG